MNKYFFSAYGVLMVVLLLSSCESKQVKHAKKFMAAGMYEQALPLLQQETMANPTNAEAHFLSGQIYLDQWDRNNAQESFERAVSLQPQYREEISQAYVRLAGESLQTNEHKTAQLYHEALRYAPDFKERAAQIFLDRGRALFQSAPQQEKAFACFTYSINFDETYREHVILFILDEVKKSLESGNTEQALSAILNMMDILPREQKEKGCALLHEIGKRFYAQGERTQFIETLGKGKRFCPDYQQNDADFLYVMGKYYSAIGEPEHAKAAFKRAGTEFYPEPAAEQARLAFDELIGLVGMYHVTDMPTELPGIVNAEHERTIASSPQKGALAFGPYVENFPSTPLTAYFCLRLDKKAKNGKVVSLDVYDARRKKVLAEKTLSHKDFTRQGEFELFELAFTPSKKSQMEFRIFCHEQASISADIIAIVDPAKMRLTNHAAVQQLKTRWE